MSQDTAAIETAAREAAAITRASGSNLALAFILLPRSRREALTLFYAFCRVIDDIADAPDLSHATKEAQLNDWKRALFEPFPGEPPLAPALRALTARHRLRENWLLEIIHGCEMDLSAPVRYATFEDLRLYCYRVASVVGIVSAELFGCTHPGSRRYAVELGYALQLTNIIRDVAKDYANDGRIYLPQDEMARFGVTEADLAERKGGPHFEALMAFQAERAEAFYASAVKERPAEDRRALAAAEMMRRVYHRLLQKIRADRFRVFDRFHRLSRWEKLGIAARELFLNPFR